MSIFRIGVVFLVWILAGLAVFGWVVMYGGHNGAGLLVFSVMAGLGAVIHTACVSWPEARKIDPWYRGLGVGIFTALPFFLLVPAGNWSDPNCSLACSIAGISAYITLPPILIAGVAELVFRALRSLEQT